jgi:hypothetical protein
VWVTHAHCGATHASRGCGADALHQQAVDGVDVSTGTKCAHFGFGHSTCMTHVVGDSGLTQTLGLFALNVFGRRLAMRGDGLGGLLARTWGSIRRSMAILGPNSGRKGYPGGLPKGRTMSWPRGYLIKHHDRRGLSARCQCVAGDTYPIHRGQDTSTNDLSFPHCAHTEGAQRVICMQN